MESRRASVETRSTNTEDGNATGQASQAGQDGTAAATPPPGPSARALQHGNREIAESEHTHPAVTHAHTHFHVSHHHVAGVLMEWQHRTFTHTHLHNHGELTHSHDYSEEDEARDHGKEAHIHDHTAPTQPRA